MRPHCHQGRSNEEEEGEDKPMTIISIGRESDKEWKYMILNENWPLRTMWFWLH